MVTESQLRKSFVIFFKLGFPCLCYSSINICRYDEILPFVDNDLTKKEVNLSYFLTRFSLPVLFINEICRHDAILPFVNNGLTKKEVICYIFKLSFPCAIYK